MKRKRIVFLIRSLHTGGAEKNLVILAKALKQKGHYVTVVILYPGGQFEAEVREAGIDLICLNKKGRWHIVTFLRCLISAVNGCRPDFVFSYLTIQNLLTLAVRLASRPMVSFVWNIQSSDMDMNLYDWFAGLTSRLEEWCSFLPDTIVTNSVAGRQFLVSKGFPDRKMKVIPNGVDTEYFCPDRRRRAELRSAWNIGDDQILIGIVARLDPIKDHPNFLKALAIVSNTVKDIKAVIVGSGPADYLNDLVDLSTELKLSDLLIWAGARTDMCNVYNALDILVSASISEGLSNVIGEAMACGVPCVVTDTGDSARIVDRYGIPVPTRSPGMLAAGILRLINDVNIQPDEIRAHVLRTLSVENLAAKTEGLLDESKNA